MGWTTRRRYGAGALVAAFLVGRRGRRGRRHHLLRLAVVLALVYLAVTHVAYTALVVAVVVGALVWHHRRRRARALDVAHWQSLTPAGFEEAVAELLVAAGWRHVRAIGGSGDLGADVVGTDPDGRPGIVQCKHLLPEAAVGSPVVLATLGAMTVHGAERALVVTTGRFTPAAADLARRHGVELVDGPALAEEARALDRRAAIEQPV
ncbi:MAG: restriction endonuclease [Acidimicrobiales bacterium]